MGKYMCHQCKAMFEVQSQYGLGQQEEKCPNCGSNDIETLPSWVPLTYNMNLYHSPSSWKYECPHCKNTFEMPVPSGPTEEKQRRCPSCGSMDIKRLTVLAIEPPLYCS